MAESKDYVVIDVENDFDNGKDKNAGFKNKDNKLVMLGAKYGKSKGYSVTLNPDTYNNVLDEKVSLVVGHHISHDLKWLNAAKMRKLPVDNPVILTFLGNLGIEIWDTQVVEYLLSGQQHKFPSLDECAERHGGTLKDDKIKQYWEDGVKTSDIPIMELSAYLENDLRNTELVFRNQVRIAEEHGMLPLVRAVNEAVFAQTAMEYNGLAIDSDFFELLASETLDMIIVSREKIVDVARARIAFIGAPMEPLFGYDSAHELLKASFNPASPAHISAALYGGSIELATKKWDGHTRYKTGKKAGQPKPSSCKVEFTFADTKGMAGSGTSEGVLKDIVDEFDDPLAKEVLKFRKMHKDIGLITSLLEKQTDDGFVHPSINLTSTNTGRQSSSNPNGQNIPSSPSQIKRGFVSRFGEDGYMVEIDYKQLEVVAVALLSKCEALIRDLKNGVDIHSKIGKIVFPHATPEFRDKYRRTIKMCVFQTIYGGHYKSLAKSLGITATEAKRIQDAFFNAYPGVKHWHRELVSGLRKQMVTLTPGTSPSMRSITGRWYVFPLNERGGLPIPKLKNYPVQGLATGDIVNIMVGRVCRYLAKQTHEILPVMQVHDSLVLDCDARRFRVYASEIKAMLEDVPKMLEETFGIDSYGLPFHVDIKVGSNLLDMVPYYC